MYLLILCVVFGALATACNTDDGELSGDIRPDGGVNASRKGDGGLDSSPFAPADTIAQATGGQKAADVKKGGQTSGGGPNVAATMNAADSGRDSCGEITSAETRLAPGRAISDPQTKGTGACDGKTLSDFLASANVTYPEISPSTLIYDPNLFFSDSPAITYAYQKPDGGFAFIYKAGSGDCPAGCTSNEYWYIESDSGCGPKQVGYYKPSSGDGGCVGGDGAPMWGRPQPINPIIACDADLTPKKIAGTYHFTTCGPHTLCSEGAVITTVGRDITIIVVQDDSDLSRGTVTVQGTGVALLDGKALPATFVRKRFQAKESFSNLPSQCPAEHDIVVNYDLDEFEPGTIQVFEMNTPDCANPGNYCKGSLKLSLHERKFLI
jgi:hypothetical protein